ncbi:MAG: alkaline phosphatase family protein, partial [Nitrososphaerales archaeon]
MYTGQNRKVIVIGLDGATFDIIRPMISQGRLKNFAKLMETGSAGSLISTILPLSSVAWSSFVSGKNPGKHGMYDFSKRAIGSYSHVPVTSLDRGAKAIWQYASEAGKRSLMVNIPLTYPPEKLNGIMISGFPYPENRQDYVWPKSVLDELRSNLGETGILKPNPQFLKEGDELKIFKEVNEITRRQTEILKYLIKKEAWNLIATVYDSTDVIGHFFWHHLDANHPRYKLDKAKIYGPLVYEVYETLDRAVGELLPLFSEKDSVFVISDHGFGPVYHAVYMNNWLIKNDYLRLKRSAGTRFRKLFFDMGITSEFLFNSVKKLHIVGTKTNTYSKNSKKVALAKKLTLSTDDIDWNESLAYASGNYGPIYINLKGREPHGKVERGEKYEALVDELTAKLRLIKNPKTGEQLIDLIYTKEDIYSGPYTDQAPD